MHDAVRLFVLLLALLWLPVGTVAAQLKKPKPVPEGRLVRVIPVRVTLFYSLKDKKTGRLAHLAAVSRTLRVKVVKPVKSKTAKRK